MVNVRGLLIAMVVLLVAVFSCPAVARAGVANEGDGLKGAKAGEAPAAEENIMTLEELLNKKNEASGSQRKKGYDSDTYRDMQKLRKEQIRENLPRELR